MAVCWQFCKSCLDNSLVTHSNQQLLQRLVVRPCKTLSKILVGHSKGNCQPPMSGNLLHMIPPLPGGSSGQHFRDTSPELDTQAHFGPPSLQSTQSTQSALCRLYIDFTCLWQMKHGHPSPKLQTNAKHSTCCTCVCSF